MAALVYPANPKPRVDRQRVQAQRHLRLVTEQIVEPREDGVAGRPRRAAQRRAVLRRRLLASTTSVGLLAALWLGAGALTSLRSHPVVRLPGAVAVGDHSLYVVRPGDTLWSIASAVEPTSDPRALMDQLATQLHGRTLVPGLRLTLP
jgi:hypothetical protein